jgi:hypothetical protein
MLHLQAYTLLAYELSEYKMFGNCAFHKDSATTSSNNCSAIVFVF